MSLLSPNFGGLLAFTGRFPSTISISRAMTGTDAMGGEIRPELWPNLYTGFSASIQEASPREVMDFGQRQIMMSHNIFFRRPASYGTIVELGDRIVDQRGSLYVVAATMDFQGGSPMIRIPAMFRGTSAVPISGIVGVPNNAPLAAMRITFTPPFGVSLLSADATALIAFVNNNLAASAFVTSLGTSVFLGRGDSQPFTFVLSTLGASPAIDLNFGSNVTSSAPAINSATFLSAEIPGLVWSNGAGTVANLSYTPW